MPQIVVDKVSNQHDLEKVFAIRKTVFVEEQNCPPALEWENEDVSIHFLASYNGKSAGACRWRKTEKGYKLERFAVLKEFRNKGIAQEMIKTVLADLPHDATYIYLHAQLTAVPLYQKMGFATQGDQFEEANIKHYKMVFKSPLK
ncbi:MAG TPA: GNAT family N-acetyltransferase [Pelobium sp.]